MFNQLPLSFDHSGSSLIYIIIFNSLACMQSIAVVQRYVYGHDLPQIYPNSAWSLGCNICLPISFVSCATICIFNLRLVKWLKYKLSYLIKYIYVFMAMPCASIHSEYAYQFKQISNSTTRPQTVPCYHPPHSWRPQLPGNRYIGPQQLLLYSGKSVK